MTQSGTTARIEVSGRAEHAVSRPDARTMVLTLEGATLPRRLERSVDTSGVSGPLLMVSAFNQPSGKVRVVVTLRGEASDQVVETSKGLVWTVISGQGERHAAEEAPEVPAAVTAQAGGFGGAAPDYALLGAPGQKQYTGQRITLEFHDIDVRNLLRLLADVSKKNMVVADDVTGKITVSLRNVPWDQALDIVLQAKGLGKQEMGNVIRIAKFDVIAKEEAAKLEAQKNRQILLPLKVRIIPVNFSTAGDLARQVKDVLTDRGTVTIDERTNVLIVKDTQEALARAEGLVRNLDTETPGVLIESRIVEANSNFTQALGVQWGGNFGFSPATGNGIPVSFPNTMTGTGASGQTPNQGNQSTPNYAVNLPAPIGQGSGGGIGLVLGSANGAFNLNLRLTALERKGMLKTISAPKVATLDNKEATISQGSVDPVLPGLRLGREHHLRRGAARAQGDAARHRRRLDPHEDQGHQQQARPEPHRRQRPALHHQAPGRDHRAREGRRHHGHRRHLHPDHGQHGQLRAVPGRHPHPRILLQVQGRVRRPHRVAHLHHTAGAEPPVHDGRPHVGGELGDGP